MDGLSPNQFKGVHMNDILLVEDLLTLNILIYDKDVVDENFIGELARRSVQKKEKNCETAAIQQPFILCEHDACCLPIIPLPQLLHLFSPEYLIWSAI